MRRPDTRRPTAGRRRAATQVPDGYCQDSALTWLDWEWDDAQQALATFTQRLLLLRATQPVFRRRDFFQGRALTGGDVKDIYRINPAGGEMQQDDWRCAASACSSSARRSGSGTTSGGRSPATASC